MKDYHKHNLDRVLNGATKKHLQLNNRISDTKSNLLKSTTNTENSSVTSNLQDNKDYDNNNKKNGINKSSLGADVANNKRLSAAERRKYYVMVVLLLIGLIIGLISLLSILMLPSFVSHQISKKLVLKNNSMLLERWSKPNIPIYFRVWVFDVVNAQEIIAKRETKPELREIGPFTFRLKRQKDIVSFASDNLYYTERKLYNFVPELSCCAINTTVTIPNIPLVAVVDRALGYQMPLVSRIVPRLINRAIQSLREQLFIRKQVREILFDGYEVQLLKMISRVGSLVGLPQTQQKFAILKGKNNTWRPELDGIWAINTGERDSKRFGKVHSWNSYRKLPFWEQNSQCNTINGSDGTLFAPPIKRDQPLYIFNQEICRSVTLSFLRNSNIRNIEAYRFGLSESNFARTMQPSKSPLLSSATRQRDTPGPVASQSEQEQLVRDAQDQEARMATKLNPYPCFCDRKSANINGINVCEFDGLIDMSKCNKQAQALFGSMPHFYQTDSRLLDQVKGLAPNATKHQTYVDIEPNTGIVLGGKRRVQLNLMIKHNNDVEGFENIRDMLVPLVWFEESAMINEETAEKFRSNYTDRVRRLNTILLTFLAGSVILFAINLHLLAMTGYGRKKYKLHSQESGLESEQQHHGHQHYHNNIKASAQQLNANSQSDLDGDSSRSESRRESAVKSPLLDSGKLSEPTRGILSEKLGTNNNQSASATTDLLMDLRSQLVSSSKETFGSSSKSSSLRSSSSSTTAPVSSNQTNSLQDNNNPSNATTIGQMNASLIDDEFLSTKQVKKRESYVINDKSNPPE